MSSTSLKMQNEASYDDWIVNIYEFARFALKVSPINQSGIVSMEISRSEISIHKPQGNMCLDFSSPMGQIWGGIWQSACLHLYSQAHGDITSNIPPRRNAPDLTQLTACASVVLRFPANVPAFIKITHSEVQWEIHGRVAKESDHKVWHAAVTNSITEQYKNNKSILENSSIIAYRYLIGRFANFRESYENERCRNENLRREMQQRSMEESRPSTRCARCGYAGPNSDATYDDE